MKVRIGCRFVHDATSATPAVVLAEPHERRSASRSWRSAGPASPISLLDLRRPLRQPLPPARASRGHLDGQLRRCSSRSTPSRSRRRARTTRSTASRTSPITSCTGSCRAATPSPTSSTTTAWELFGKTEPGAERALASRAGSTRTSNTAFPACRPPRRVEIFERRGGMCRDMAHLGVTFCRALGIPARYIVRLHARHRDARPVSAHGLPRLVRGLARRTLVDARRPLQHAADRTRSRSAAAATRPTSR